MKNFGIFLRPNVEGMDEIVHRLSEFAKAHSLHLFFEKDNAYAIRGIDFEEMEKCCDMLISFGGDGTLIWALHQISSLPILGVNAGNLGFLTGLRLGDFFDFFPLLLRGEFEILPHSMFSVFLDGQRIGRILNEVLISKKTFPAMIEIEAKINQKMFNHYRCDGLIIATPTGSTAYNISAGGSVVYPYCKNILLTPLAPHSLTQRPMILGSDVHLEFEVMQEAQIIIDGQEVFDFSPKSSLRVCDDGESARLIYPKERDYFMVLREKFSWGD